MISLLETKIVPFNSKQWHSPPLSIPNDFCLSLQLIPVTSRLLLPWFSSPNVINKAGKAVKSPKIPLEVQNETT
jgi:hypothetical protein